MSRHQKILIGVAIGFLIYSLLGFLAVPVVLKNILEKELSRTLKRTVTIDHIQINPYLLQAAVNNFTVKSLSGENDFIAFEQLFIDLEAVSLIKKGLIIRSLVLNGPKINVTRYQDRKFNFSDLAADSDQEKNTDSKPFLYSLNNIEILNGAITFNDEPKKAVHRIRSLNLSVPFLSNLPHRVETHVQPSLFAVVDNAPVKISGQTTPFHESRTSFFNLQINKINLPSYLEYLPPVGDLTLQSGMLDMSITIGFEITTENRPAVKLAGDFSLKNIVVGTSGAETYLTIPQLDLKLADAKPLEKEFHFSRISCDEPQMLVRRSSTGALLPMDLLPEKAESTADRSQAAGRELPFRLAVDEIFLNSGTLQFEDRHTEDEFTTTLNPVDLKVTDFSTLEGAKTAFEIALQTEAGEKAGINGTMVLFPMAVDLQIDLQDLRVKKYNPYFNEFVTIRAEDGGMDLAAALSFARNGETLIFKAENFNTAVETLVINDQDNKSLLSIPSLTIKDGSLASDSRTITIGEIQGQGGRLQLERRKDGLVILNEIFKPRKTEPQEQKASAPETSSPWQLTLNRGTIDQYSIVLHDLVPAEPTELLFDDIHLTAETISTAPGVSGSIDLGFLVDKQGAFSLKGPLSIKPLSASLAVNLAGLPVKTIQPYFADRVKLVVSDGSISADGKLNLSRDSTGNLNSIFQGNGGIADFASFDPVAGEDFLKWKVLNLDGLAFDSSRNSLTISRINWQDFYNKIVVFKDGGLNLDAVLQQSAGLDDKTTDQKDEDLKEKSSLRLAIDSIRLANGQVDFMDRNITPHFSGSFSELSGTVSGISSQDDETAEVNISGSLNQHAPLQITGKINPLGKNLFADLFFDFSNIELSPTSPYTGKYIGYNIAKGKLSLDLEYTIDGTKITGKNQAFLDQFTLGQTVDSPDAMNLPIKLAIALLKNRQGEITLNVPVKGDLSDPQFSIGGVVFKAVVSLIAKAATSPFALLGAFLPEGEDLQYIDFSAGSADLTDEYRSRLEAIAKALYERPALEMDIKGSVNPEKDRTALHEKRFAQLLKNEKFKALTKNNETVSAPEEITVTPEEFETYLKKAYSQADIEKPKNVLGLDKKQEPAEMEERLRQSIKITDDDLRLLAIQRAEKVKSFLVESGPVEPERLFIVEPAISESGAQRVEMIIK